nr:hypothetical protein [Polynucleobacter sp. JS-Polo-80-F4]
MVTYLERLNALRIVEVKTMQVAQKNFIAAESAVLECEKNLTALTDLKENECFIQSVGKNRWLISSKDKPAIQIGVVIDEKTGLANRMNWRQVFE